MLDRGGVPTGGDTSLSRWVVLLGFVLVLILVPESFRCASESKFFLLRSESPNAIVFDGEALIRARLLTFCLSNRGLGAELGLTIIFGGWCLRGLVAQNS